MDVLCYTLSVWDEQKVTGEFSQYRVMRHLAGV
jgi:hypothetical protein